MITEFSIHVSALEDLALTNTSSNQIVFKYDSDNGTFKARMKPTSSAEGIEIDGCPFPPGCTP